MKHKLVIWNPVLRELKDFFFQRVLGPYLVCSWLRNHGVQAQVIEWVDKWDLEDLVETTSKITAQNGYVGINSTFFLGVEPEEIKKARSELKKRRPDLKWVLGGARTFVVDKNEYDHVVTGFGEDPMIKLLNHGLGKIWHPSLEEATFHYGDAIVEGEALPMILGRGCRFACKFCSYDLIGRKPGTYERTEENVLKDQEERLKLGANSTIYILDDTINESDIKLNRISALKNADPAFHWGGYLRLDLIWAHRDKQISLLKDTGLATSFHGIESFHPRASQSIGKGWSGKHGKSFLKELYVNQWNNEVSSLLSFIAGLPYESLEDILQTRDWLQENVLSFANWRIGPLYISREDKASKSEFELNYEKYGYQFLDNDRPENWTFGDMSLDSLNAFLYHNIPSTLGYGNRICYYFFFLLLSLGYKIEDLKKINKNNKLNLEEAETRQAKKFDEYLTKFKSIHL